MTEDDQIALRRHYRNTFLSKSGKIVLEDLMNKNYFLNDDMNLEQPELIGKRNTITNILNMLACADKPELTMQAIIEAFDKWPIISTET